MTSTLMHSTWVIGQFRGLVYRVSRPVLIHKNSEKVLKYRGVSYQPLQSITVRMESGESSNKYSSTTARQISKQS
jgi:hypothetical protein